MRSTVLMRVMAAAGIAAVVAVVIALTDNSNAVDPSSTHQARPTTTVVIPPTTTTVSMAPRPGTIELANVNPCKILTTAQRGTLSLDSTPTPYTDPEFDQAKACSMRGTQSGTEARLALVTSMGVDVWLSDTAQVDARAVTASGYPALVVRTPGLATVCNVEVDAADNEFLDVMFRDGGNKTPIPQDALCQGAQQIADEAVTSLVHNHQ
ncbi:MAG TPA: DUF3558 domain-containing protein [Pseudonocardiaceae bacterium]|nr:DUF3558 domain-containing protein [Pseudonocardiaceae bacterium]